MFSKILIANRGEIACRVIDTAHRLGVSCVAVYSDADAGARHVDMADEAVHIGGSAPADSYLNGEAIIDAARASGAEAIHPGYGFLSENPAFVEASEAAGLIFVGPSAQSMRTMGLKDAAKALMVEAGVPVVPGYHGADQDAEHLQAEAAKIGYPVMIKAVAGGGGKGMRLVERPGDFAQALQSARAEAQGAFGNDAVLVEIFVKNPRHIEIQIFGDGIDVVHLYERDCSLQRRHQKVIEEAPAPGMTQDLRAAMCDAAVRAAKAIGYEGAGTVEFIVDGSDGLRTDRFWFMEMNTRLQVEHPVTEAITGVDLVEWQLRVACGEALPKRQDQLQLNGHSFEARLYAEDVPKGFLPATGRLTHLAFPPGARIETGVRAGDEISPYYDPMIAKLIVHGATRDIALLRLSRALMTTEIAGTVTNLTFLGKLSRHQGFTAGDVDTGLIGRDIDSLSQESMATGEEKALAAVVAVGLDDGAGWATGFSLWAPLRTRIRLVGEDGEFEANLQVLGRDQVRVTLNETTHEFRRSGDRWVSVGQASGVRAIKIGATVHVFSHPARHFDISDPLAVAAGPNDGGHVIEAPMPGNVKAVFAKPGQKVAAGDRLAILEAMKMEHTLAAHRDGIVDEVLVEVGAQVQAGSALITLVKDTP
ncbi:MAG: ATP-binding protein [Paracoccaceae bacterium]